MTFIQSIKTCFRKYFDFKGRAMRSEFWWFQLFVMVVSFAGMMIDSLLPGYSPDNSTVTPLYTIGTLALLLPTATVTARRLHDIGWTGWIQLPSFIVYSAFLDAFIPGFSISTLGVMLMTGGILYWFVLVLILIRDSKPLTNKYGPNPKSPDMGEVFT